MDDPTLILDEALEDAIAGGLRADGWLLEATSLGYCAWLYADDDQESSCISLMDPVEGQPTAVEAARWCAGRVAEMVGGQRWD